MTAGPAPEWSVDSRAFEAAFLELELLAATPYARFVHGSESRAIEVDRVLLRRGAAEFGPPYGRLLLEAGRPIGLIAVLTAPELQAVRMRAALVLHREGVLQEDPGLDARLRLAARCFSRPGPGDLYLSRIAVVPDLQGGGVGAALLSTVEAIAAGRGCDRVVLDVEAANRAAVRFYEMHGFDRTGRDPAAEGPAPALEYLHLAKSAVPRR